jgi:hypothetical protein
MVLIDTSVWISHLREAHTDLAGLLNDGKVASHPFIVGELACGNLNNRTLILALLKTLPMTPLVDHEEVLTFIENYNLMGKGLGYIDVHLLASAAIAGLPLWTLDKKLERVADTLRLKY